MGLLSADSPFLSANINSGTLRSTHNPRRIWWESYPFPFLHTLFLNQINKLLNFLLQRVVYICLHLVCYLLVKRVLSLKRHSELAYKLFHVLSSPKSTSLGYYGILLFLPSIIFNLIHRLLIQVSNCLLNINCPLLNCLFLKVILSIPPPFLLRNYFLSIIHYNPWHIDLFFSKAYQWDPCQLFVFLIILLTGK